MTLDELILLVGKLTEKISGTIALLIISVSMEIFRRRIMSDSYGTENILFSVLSEVTEIISTCFWWFTIMVFIIYFIRRLASF